MLELPDGEFKEPQTRQPQSNRVLPSARNVSKRNRAESGDTGAGSSATRPKSNIEYRERMARQAVAFEQNRPANVEQFQKWAPDKISFSQHLTSSIQAMYQSQVDAVADAEVKDHKCVFLHDDADFDAESIKVTIRDTVVFDIGRNFVLKVPTCYCQMCSGAGASGVIRVPPCAVNCGPTTPSENCLSWITDEALHLFGDLHARNGLSLSGKLLINLSRTDIHVN